jgi:hypothetical protein
LDVTPSRKTPKRFDAGKSVAKSRLNTKKNPQTKKRSKDKFKLAGLGAMALRTGLPNENGSPVCLPFDFAPYVKVMISALLFGAIFRPFDPKPINNSPVSPDDLF